MEATQSIYDQYPEYLYGDVEDEKIVDNLLQSEFKIDFPIEKLVSVIQPCSLIVIISEIKAHRMQSLSKT